VARVQSQGRISEDSVYALLLPSLPPPPLPDDCPVGVYDVVSDDGWREVVVPTRPAV
jgi:hypothetical protein